VPNRSAVSTTDALVAGSAAARTPSALLYVMLGLRRTHGARRVEKSGISESACA